MATRYKEKLKMLDRKCPVCGKVVIASARSHGQKYCSRECYKVAAYERARKRKLESLITVRCAACGKTFQAKKYNNVKYCSDICRYPLKNRGDAVGHYEKPKKPKIQKPHAPTVRGQMMVGIIPKTHGWNGPCGRELERPKTAPRAILKCDPSKLPYRGEPTRQYSGPDPKVREYKAALEANKTWHLKF